MDCDMHGLSGFFLYIHPELTADDTIHRFGEVWACEVPAFIHGCQLLCECGWFLNTAGSFSHEVGAIAGRVTRPNLQRPTESVGKGLEQKRGSFRSSFRAVRRAVTGGFRAGPVPPMASNLLEMASNLPVMASNLL